MTYQHSDPVEDQEEVKPTTLDIVAMIIAALQLLLPPVLLMIGVGLFLYLAFLHPWLFLAIPGIGVLGWAWKKMRGK